MRSQPKANSRTRPMQDIATGSGSRDNFRLPRAFPKNLREYDDCLRCGMQSHAAQRDLRARRRACMSRTFGHWERERHLCCKKVKGGVLGLAVWVQHAEQKVEHPSNTKRGCSSHMLLPLGKKKWKAESRRQKKKRGRPSDQDDSPSLSTEQRCRKLF